MIQTTASRWVRLQDGERLVGNLWPDSGEQQRRETVISALWSGKVPMRARMAAKPCNTDLQPALPMLKRPLALGTSTPIPGIEAVLLKADPRTIKVDIRVGRIGISAFIANDDKGLWAPFFPGWLTSATGRFIDIEFNDIEFERAAARTYMVETLLPAGATPSDAESAAGARQTSTNTKLMSAVAKAVGTLGRPGKVVQWSLFCDHVRAECKVTSTTRGYGDKSISRAVKTLETEQDILDISDMSNMS